MSSDKRKLSKIELGCMSKLYGIGFYEIKYYWINPDGDNRFNRMEISFSKLKKLGVVKVFNSPKKINTWLNTEGGKRYVVDKLNEMYANTYEL